MRERARALFARERACEFLDEEYSSRHASDRVPSRRAQNLLRPRMVMLGHVSWARSASNTTRAPATSETGSTDVCDPSGSGSYETNIDSTTGTNTNATRTTTKPGI